MEDREILHSLHPKTDFEKLMVSESINRELKGLIRVMERLAAANSARLQETVRQLNKAQAELVQLRKDIHSIKTQHRNNTKKR